VARGLALRMDHGTQSSPTISSTRRASGGWRLFLLVNTVGWLVTALGVIALIEGIIYLTKTDEEFEHTYVVGKKQWF